MSSTIQQPTFNHDDAILDETTLERIRQLEEKIKDKENTIKELEKANSNLKKQASKYQSALGASMNFGFGDEDKNNSVQLTEDILHLQDSLEIYITNLRPKIDVDLKNVTNLLRRYKSKTRLTSKLSNIPLIKAVLQRHILDTIFNYFSIYEKYKVTNQSYSLEAKIAHQADELVLLTKEFAKMREGNDSITPAVPVKIRQQIYSALGNRGFSNIIDNQQTFEHEFVNNVKTQLNEEMEKYRRILDDTKKEVIEEKATSIILDVIRIFKFRINTQEPVSQFRYFQYKDKIDPSLMIGTWDDENFEDFEVDICKFPLIGIELDDDSKRKIYTQALIHSREVNSSETDSQVDLEVSPQANLVVSSLEANFRINDSETNSQVNNLETNSQVNNSESSDGIVVLHDDIVDSEANPNKKMDKKNEDYRHENKEEKRVGKKNGKKNGKKSIVSRVFGGLGSLIKYN